MQPGTLTLAMQILVIVILTGALWWGIGRAMRVRLPLADPERARRIQALLSLGQSLLRAVVLITALLMVLDLMGLNLGPLLTGAGILGIVVGLGAQSLIRDLLAGLIVVLEGPFGIGDLIHTAGVSGKVERITLRATYVRDADGTLHVIPNSMLGVISNLSWDWARVIVDLPVPRGTRLEALQEALEQATRALREDPELQDRWLEPPTVAGIETIGETALIVRVEAKTRPADRWTVARRLRYHLLQALQTEPVPLSEPG
ncbi:MAG: mechanosensitive ion channel family protein [Thermoflexus sp.]|jgi:small conductance mechanosensitive channel|nr:mechanosensitive ion channel family protein [Thermoflexus sp.]